MGRVRRPLYDFPCERLPWSEVDRKDALHSLGKLWSRRGGGLGRISRGLCKDSKTLKAQSHREFERLRMLCLFPNATQHGVSPDSMAREKSMSVIVNGKLLSVDDIVFGYETLFQRRFMHSAVTSHRVGMQQDPSDAFAIADLLWRVRPRLLIELGTSGGGSAVYYARTMLGYDPHAQVLTMDPAIDTEPLVNWNHAQMDVFCPWCLRANETNVWKRHVTYVNMLPTTAKALDTARRFADSVVASGHHVVVMEDSNHDYAVVKSNVWAYAKLVTPGSYLIVQDTRLGRYYGPSQATREWLGGPGKGSFVRDRRPEYFLFSQHAGGFLRRLTRDEQLAEWDQLA